jgi:uncharacterized protein with HEPN domain
MPKSSLLRLTDIVEAIERIKLALRHAFLEAFESDWRKARREEIPWRKIARIGNVLRHDDESVSAPVIWKLVAEDLPVLEKACR